MKKKLFGLFFIATLTLTLTTTTLGAAPSGDSSSHCWGTQPPLPECVCINGVWTCPLR